jgi:hypothetical protein
MDEWMCMRVGICMFVCMYVYMYVCIYDVQGIQRMSDMFKEFDKDNSGTIDRNGMRCLYVLYPIHRT